MKLYDSDIERFWKKVDKKSDSECWNWLAGNSGGYGTIWTGSYGSITAHRVSYFLEYGDDPKGFHIHHTCENKKCVNPKHLEKISARDHMLMGDNIVAKLARQTHCKRGHEFTEENTYMYDGERHCRKCHALAQNAHMRGVELS